jgi:two-component sensor histidine kinase
MAAGHPQWLPHAFCLIEDPNIMVLHIASDAVIAMAYFSIPTALLFFYFRRRAEIGDNLSLAALLFVLFILACGVTHALGIWVLWWPHYDVEGVVKAATGTVSVLAAVVVWRMMPALLAMPAPERLMNMNSELEAMVRARTTALERTNAELSDALRDKDLLLRETHHRVKNNLQLITSLINMKQRMLPQEVAPYLERLRECIFAMARVHNQLQHEDSGSELDLEEFVGALAKDLAQVHARDLQPRISVEVTGPKLMIAFDDATPLALILNEIITNALMHVPSDRPPEVAVTVPPLTKGIQISVADNGSGLGSEEADPSFGLTLVGGLATQLRATVRWVSAPSGTTVLIDLPWLSNAERSLTPTTSTS